jgi:hypothetical protein
VFVRLLENGGGGKCDLKAVHAGLSTFERT